MCFARRRSAQPAPRQAKLFPFKFLFMPLSDSGHTAMLRNSWGHPSPLQRGYSLAGFWVHKWGQGRRGQWGPETSGSAPASSPEHAFKALRTSSSVFGILNCLYQLRPQCSLRWSLPPPHGLHWGPQVCTISLKGPCGQFLPASGGVAPSPFTPPLLLSGPSYGGHSSSSQLAKRPPSHHSWSVWNHSHPRGLQEYAGYNLNLILLGPNITPQTSSSTAALKSPPFSTFNYILATRLVFGVCF